MIGMGLCMYLLVARNRWHLHLVLFSGCDHLVNNNLVHKGIVQLLFAIFIFIFIYFHYLNRNLAILERSQSDNVVNSFDYFTIDCIY